MGVTTWTETQDAILLNGLKANQTYAQIANLLGVSKAMVSGRIHRLRKLRHIKIPAKQEKASSKNSKPKSILRAKPSLNLDWQSPSIAVVKPKNPPVRFSILQRGYCTWCVEDGGAEARANMMCCAAQVMDKSKREGDRRSSHCAYHYEMSQRRFSQEVI